MCDGTLTLKEDDEMPNHVTSRLTGPKELIDIITGEEDGKPCVDFNRVIPCPDYVWKDGVNMAVETAAEIALGLIQWDSPPRNNAADDFKAGNFGGAASVLHYSNCVRQLQKGPFVKDFNDQDFEAFVSFMRAYRQCGEMHGLNWNRKFWGTKWNAYETNRVSDTVVTFETAWSAPHPVMMALAKKAKVAFVHEWADEDTGSNVGRVKYKATNPESSVVEDLSNTNAGYELAFNLDPNLSDNYVLVDGKYTYREES